ncbi:MAG TPA: hypothetical protein VKZ49_13700 [Polyangiaceae bacterium]|nr:hypothetical protein [Polyangiaceae bacterium]
MATRPRRPWVALTSAALLCATLSSCMMPPPASERVTDAARELNLAARFGRLDLAASRTHRAARASFIERHAHWGSGLRVVDVELTSLAMQDEGRAVVQVDVSWVRADEGTLRRTRLAQLWQEEDGAWLLMRESRAAGDPGLFGEVVYRSARSRPDVHFESRTIR